jgi:hypothetical protein
MRNICAVWCRRIDMSTCSRRKSRSKSLCGDARGLGAAGYHNYVGQQYAFPLKKLRDSVRGIGFGGLRLVYRSYIVREEHDEHTIL